MTDYRDASTDDAPAIDALFRASFVATFGHLYDPADLSDFLGAFTQEAWRRELADPALAFHVVEDDAGLIGFAKQGPIELPVTPRGPAMELRQFYLTARAQGSGVAQTLIARVVDCARARGADELFLSVYTDNHRARRFYARQGFVDVGRYDFRVGNHVDEDRLMRLDLTS